MKQFQNWGCDFPFTLGHDLDLKGHLWTLLTCVPSKVPDPVPGGYSMILQELGIRNKTIFSREDQKQGYIVLERLSFSLSENPWGSVFYFTSTRNIFTYRSPWKFIVDHMIQYDLFYVTGTEVLETPNERVTEVNEVIWKLKE